jgi:hypothetical protein
VVDRDLGSLDIRARLGLLATIIGALWAVEALADGTSSIVSFSQYTPLSANTELARRLISPVKAAQLPELVARAGKALRAQPVDLVQEKFFVYVPAEMPAAGYGLLVFVPPWNEARLPEGWQPILDEEGVVFVSAVNSGNDANPIGRREPLALLAEANAVEQYKIDPSLIFVGGFSGGSRVAMRLAMGYPDVFRGALLNSGSDPIGKNETPIPPRDLFQRFQEQSRLVYVTGEEDVLVLATDGQSASSMRDACMFNVEKRTMVETAHHSATPAALAWALDELSRPVVPDGNLASCRAALGVEVSGKLTELQSLIAAGKRDEARTLLNDMDAHYGGLAMPKLLELSEQLAAAQP